jgi:putative nucleotidyltransferase with HDIG domain
MKRILIVDDDENMRKILSRTLMAAEFEVVVAAGGRPAQEILNLEDFDIVLSDIKMPDGDGIELTRFLKKIKPLIPIILMTGFSEIYSATQAYELGANEFIPKPFKKEELLSAITHCLENPNYNQEVDSVADEYCKLSLIDFVSGNNLPADVYLRLSEKKFIKIAHKGDKFPVEQLEKFKKFGLIHLHMRKVEFNDYIGFNIAIGKQLEKNSKIPKEKKLNFMKHTTEVIMERLFLDGIDKDNFEMAKTVTETTVNLIMEDSNVFKMLDMLNSHSDELYAHSMGVSLYGVMLARHMHWASPPTLFKIATGGLLHDIGKKELPRELLNKSRGNMSREEVELYESHPVRGLKILGEVRSIPSDILQIVVQHHENCLGQGFPAKLSRLHIFPLARLVSVVDIFCNLIIRPDASSRMSIKDAILQMQAVDAPMLDKEMFAALVNMCGFKVQN